MVVVVVVVAVVGFEVVVFGFEVTFGLGDDGPGCCGICGAAYWWTAIVSSGSESVIGFEEESRIADAVAGAIAGAIAGIDAGSGVVVSERTEEEGGAGGAGGAGMGGAGMLGC